LPSLVQSSDFQDFNPPPPPAFEGEHLDDSAHEDEFSAEHIANVLGDKSEDFARMQSENESSVPTDKDPLVAAPANGVTQSAGGAHGMPEGLEETDDPSEDVNHGRVRMYIPRRVLRASHFKSAMKEITPSSSEDGNLAELRKVSLDVDDSVRCQSTDIKA
jgi:hypothetical protein